MKNPTEQINFAHGKVVDGQPSKAGEISQGNSTNGHDEPLLSIVLFNNQFDNEPSPREYTWKQLKAKYFSTHTVRKEKGGMVFSPVIYDEGTTRKNANVKAVYCAVFDIEHNGAFDEIRANLAGYRYAAYSTFSHRHSDPRYRLIIPLAKPVAAELWPIAWQRLNLWMGGIDDPSTKDAARIYYLPSRPPGSQEYFIEEGEGKAIDIDDLPELSSEKLEKIHASVRSSHETKPHKDLTTSSVELSSADGLAKVLSKCNFMKEISVDVNQAQVSRQLWMAMVSNASMFESSEGWIHDASRHHDKYDEVDTDKMIESCRSFGSPITCDNVRENGYTGCPKDGCKTISGKTTKAPAGLGARSRALEKAALGGESSAVMPKILREFLANNFRGGLLYCDETFYTYIKGYWKRLDQQADIRNSIARFLGDKATPTSIGGIQVLLQDFQSVSGLNFKPDQSFICMQNGALNTATFNLEAHSPDHGLVNALDIEWNPGTQCPRWLEFLDEIFTADGDKPQKIGFLQQWFGYCLTPDVSQHKFVWMVGAGGNGKSVLLSVLEALVGTKNVGHAQMERFESGAVRAELEGKLLNISSEMSATATISDGYLKKITGGDPIEAERKFKQPHTFKPTVKLIAATNNLPRLLDNSEGFARRAVILSFNRKFTQLEMDPTLSNKLMNELPGIAVWAIQGLKNLRENQKFDIPASAMEALKQYREDSDPVATFIKDCLQPSKEKGYPPIAVYGGYCEWVKERGFHALSIVGFGRRLADYGFERHRSAGKDYWKLDMELPDKYFPEKPVKISTQNEGEKVNGEANVDSSKKIKPKF
ncbi:MAG: phage/plasmid primase, P4 family [Pseudomonadota bacterium]